MADVKEVSHTGGQPRPPDLSRRTPAGLVAPSALEEVDDVACVAEGVGDHPSVVERDGRAELVADLGDEHHPVRSSRAVEFGEPAQSESVIFA